MKSPICVSNICVTNRKQTASFSIVSLLLAIAPLWLMLAATNTSAPAAQTPDNVSKASATTTPAPSPADWTQFMRDNMQRWNPYETILNANNVGGLQAKWVTRITDCCYTGPPESSPAVANGFVYVGSPTIPPFAGGPSNAVYALNASTGAILWSYTTGSAVVSSPAVANGVVYFGSDDFNVYALNASTGAKLWSYATRFYVESSPAVANGVVYAGCGANLCALNASTGAKLWSYADAGGTPAVANAVVYVGCSDGLCALNASTGAKLWSNPDAGGTPAVANGVVYVGFGPYVYALNASTGAKLWSTCDPEYCGYSTFGTPAVANGVVFIPTGQGELFELNASTGAVLWGPFYVTQQSSPSIVDGVVYLTAGDAGGNLNVYALSLLGSADLFLRIRPTPETVHQGDLITYAFPVWNLGPNNADYEVLNTQVPAGTTLDYIRISGTPGLGTCTAPPYQGTRQIVCHENSAMAPNTTWTVRVVAKVTAPAGTVITESAATMTDTPDPNLANNTATVSITVQ